MGKVKNTGLELDMRIKIYSDRDWFFQIFGNFAHNENRIMETH